jgi:hypothetical protein
MRLLLLALIIILGTIACSGAGEFDRRISSSDENYVSEVAGALDAAGVDFRALRDGSIAYRSRDEHKVASIEEQLKKDIAARASSKR